MTEKEKQKLYETMLSDFDCGTFILTPKYVDKLICKHTKKSKGYLKRIMKIIQKWIAQGEC